MNATLLKKYWNKVTRIGYSPSMGMNEEVRLYTLNALMAISTLIIFAFLVINVALGAYSILRSLLIVPILVAVVYCNHRGKYELTGYLLSYFALAIVLLLALLERRTGSQYVLIAIGCCSVMIFDRPLPTAIAFATAFFCYAYYTWYDANHEFHRNPNIPYAFAQNSQMFISGLIVVSQAIIFKSMINRNPDEAKAKSDAKNLENSLDKAKNQHQTLKESTTATATGKDDKAAPFMQGLAAGSTTSTPMEARPA